MERQPFHSLLADLRAEYERVDAERCELLDERKSFQFKSSKLRGGAYTDLRLATQSGGLRPVSEPAQMPKRPATPAFDDSCTIIDDIENVAISVGDVVPDAIKSMIDNSQTPKSTAFAIAHINSLRSRSSPKSGTQSTTSKHSGTQSTTSKRWEVLGNSTLCREARLMRLRSWFDRLNESTNKGNEGLSLSWLQTVVDHVHGKGCMGIPRIQHVLACLEPHRAECLNDYELEMGLQSANHQKVESLSFQTFADILFPETAKHLDEQEKRDAVLIHNALITTHVEELVAHYARLPTIAAANNNEPVNATPSRVMDVVAGVVILLNGLAIGISSDIAWQGWDTLDLAFTIFFIFEILLKMWLTGLREFLCGSDRFWNAFDGVVVLLAVFDVALGAAEPSNSANLKELSFIRLARLARLTRMMRLVRVLRLRMFKELLLMVKGVVAGLRTLFWAIVMLLFITYACAVLLRQTVGEDRHQMDDKYNTVLFGSVHWSMIVVFRCFMSDCSLPDGTPIPAHLYEMYGVLFAIPYGLITVFVFFGVFNIVTALIVETIMEAARQRRLMSKDDEKVRVGQLITRLVMKVAQEPSLPTTSSSLAQALTRGSQKQSTETQRVHVHGEVTREMFQRALNDPDVVRLIEDLDIFIGDSSDLFDVVDADGSGCIDLGELISGIMKLLSGETKSDTVAIVLAIRHMRNSLQNIQTMAAEAKAYRVAPTTGSRRPTPITIPSYLDGDDFDQFDI